MKYWLRKPGTSDFTNPLTLDEIGAQIESGTLSWDSEALEAEGQSFGKLKRSTDWVPLSSLFSPEGAPVPAAYDAATQQEQSPMKFLQGVRRRTCYSALREMIGVFAALSIVAIVVLAGFAVVAGLGSESALPVVIGVVAGLLGCFLVIAGKQSSLLLVDIADTLIEQNRKRRNITE